MSDALDISELLLGAIPLIELSKDKPDKKRIKELEEEGEQK